MRAPRHLRAALLTALAAGAALAGGCSDFLTGPGLTETPNAATNASPAQLFVASQITLFNQQNGQLARFAALFTQQLSGTNNQQQDYGRYTVTEQDVNTFWAQSYIGGGLRDLRRIQAQARAGNDQRLLGMALVLEALRFGTAASIWGDIPYREAADSAVATPKLDPQQEVYAAVQARLDTAIAALQAPAAGQGALFQDAQDFVYGGNTTRWVKAAYTLKARYHLHTAERLGAPAYAAALAAAERGIDEAPATAAQAINGQAPGDFRTAHGQTVNVDANQWAQFLRARTDMTANQQFVALLQARSDPRLPVFFSAATGGGYRGADQFGRNAAGASVVAAAPRLAYDFRQPLVTWAENQLILAEARFQTGDAAGALGAVNAVRRAAGQPELAGPVTLARIAEEKYVSLFQNVEVWSDYKRLCYPRLTPSGANFTSAAAVPGRLVYAFSERNGNPNVPAPSAQPERNWNDPSACPAS